MGFAEGLVAFDHSRRHEMLDNALRSIFVHALRVIDDPGAVEAAVHAGRDPTIDLPGHLGRFREIIDKRLLASGRHGEDIDLGDDRGIGANNRHARSPL